MKINNGIITLTESRIPTIVAYSQETEKIIIGEEARKTGLKGKTSIYNFKMDIGKGDSEFSKIKKYWMAPTGKYDVQTVLYSAKEAATIYLKELLSGIDVPEQVLIGEPAIRDQVWKENFRRHMREIFRDVNEHTIPVFFPEPFAVFQYYRNEFLEKSNKSEIVIVIDVGGGTFNSCLIKTTDEGFLSRGGGTSLPLGMQAEECGGCEVDRGLLEILIGKAKKEGIHWKDDPSSRATKEGSSVMLLIEDAKIFLSDSIGQNARLMQNFSGIKIDITIQKGQLHPDLEISVSLNGEDLKKVIRNLWRKKWGRIIIETINESKEALNKLKYELKSIDKILVAGGSSKLPFMKEEILVVLPTLVKEKNIKIASYLGRSVAAGLAYECMDQINKNPKLKIDKIAPCLLNELYLGIKKGRRDKIISPKIRRDGNILKSGQLLSEPFIVEEYKIAFEFEMPFEVNDKIFYCFGDQPFEDNFDVIPLNLNNDVFSINTDKKIVKKWRLEIEIKKNGMIQPTFIYKEKGRGANKDGVRIELPEFYFLNFNLRQGNSFIGIDFGTSNSYVVKFFKTLETFHAAEYPKYSINRKCLEKLRDVEKEIVKLNDNDLLTSGNIFSYSKQLTLQHVFHSNKIEGNPLTMGETKAVLITEFPKNFNKDQREAFNLEKTYVWMLQNNSEYSKEPENFIRMINKKILDGIENEAGKYRRRGVKLAGMNYEPPISTSVPSFMDQLSFELKEGPVNRSALEFAAAMHTKLVSIHPFIDGNGRTARILLNSILIHHKLPPIIVNFADKQRYLSALSDSNDGEISPLVEFFIECFTESLDEFKSQFHFEANGFDDKLLDNINECPIDEGIEYQDPIGQALKDIGGLDRVDPIQLAMQKKIENSLKVKEETYNLWAKNFLKLKTEFETIIDEFNANVIYRSSGFSIRIFEYDMLTFDKYSNICSGKKASRTWFFSIELYHPKGKERFLFFFVSCFIKKRHDSDINPVSLVIARSDGTSHIILKNEPICLREIAFSDNQLLLRDHKGEILIGDLNMHLRQFIASIIIAYF